MEIKILGSGCAKCASLEKATKEAIAQAGIEATVTKVEDVFQIMQFGVMVTPALVADGKVLVKGKVPSVKELIDILSKHKA